MGTITKASEIGYFLRSMACGALMIIIYDFLRAGRREKTAAALICIQDILWLASLGLLLYALAFRRNFGIVRWYSFFGMALGALCFKLAMGDRLMKLLRKLYALFARLFCFMVKILTLPIRIVFRLIKRPIGVVVWHSREASAEMSDILKVLKLRAVNRIRK